MSFVVPGCFIYLATPRTGSMATAATFKRAIHSPTHHTGIQWFKDQGYLDEVVITCVRNHYDVMASLWLLNNKPEPFSDFLRNYIYKPYMTQDTLYGFHTDVKRYWKYEHLQDNIDSVCKEFALPPRTLEVQNRTPSKKHWMYYYTNDTLRIVRERFLDEMIMFGY